MTTIYFVRHGETDANKKGIFQGHLDVPLSCFGRRQASMAALALKEVPFDAVYSSDLKRAKETSEAIMKYQNCRLVLDARLREVHLGIFQGNTLEQNEALYPREMALFRADPINYIRPGGESLTQLQDRAQRALADYIKWNRTQEDDAVLGIVAHGGTISAILRGMGYPQDFQVVRNCSISVFQESRNSCTVKKFNDVSHLENAESGPPVKLL